MNNGFSFQDALLISKTDENQKIFSIIQKQLEEGRQGEDIIASYLLPAYQGYFQGFIQYMNMKDTLAAVLSVVRAERTQKEEILKGLLYPSLLFVGVNMGVLLFNSCILPVMTNMMAGFHYQNDTILLVQKIVSLIAAAVLFFLCAGSVLFFYCLQKKNIVFVYHTIQKKYPHALIVKYASSDFSRFYLECIRRQIPTRESLQILMQLDQKPLVKDIAEQLDHLLTDGIEMKEAVERCRTEPALVRIFQISIYASNCVTMMEGYLQMVKDRTAAEIARYARTVQLISYSAVAMIIILVYQVLLMPISMMETL